MITAHHLVFGKNYSGIFKIPYQNVTRTDFAFSTINKDLIVRKLDGSTQSYSTPKSTDFTTVNPSTFATNYSPALNGDIEITTLGGNSDVYSLYIGGFISADNLNKLNIQDFGIWIKQFPNLYSFKLDYYCYGFESRKPIIKGDLADVPKSVERIRLDNFEIINNTTDIYFNFNSLGQGSKLKYFSLLNTSSVVSTNLKFIGDLSNLPTTCVYFSTFIMASTSSISYTAGKTWASSFDTLNLGNGNLSVTDTDNLLIDLNNSITTAIGSKVINLANCVRTSASDTAVAGLTAKGFTVTVQSAYQITFDLGQNVTINGSVTRAEGHDGRLNAIQFGSGNLVSADPLPASQVWSIAFWMKSGANNTGIAQILTNAVSAQTRDILFGIFFNIGGVDSQICASAFTHNVAFNNLGKTTGEAILNNTWRHYVIIIDTTKPAAGEISIYIDKVGKTLNKLYNTDNTYTFKSSQIQIGLNHNSTASMSPIKMFNYPLSQIEIDNLYNE